jgi:competence protein ComEC
MAPPLEGLAEWSAGLVGDAATLPGAGWSLPEVSLLWTVGTLGVIAGVFGGWYKGRRVALAVSVLVCGVWLWAPVIHNVRADRNAALRVTMFDVGDGSCYLLRSGGRAMVFDCGSANYLDITSVAVGPALRAMGVMEIDTLVLSHPDMDHFSGAPELIDGFGVRRLLVTRVFLDEAASRPTGSAAALLEHARSLDVSIETIAAGWSERWGDVELEALWPRPDARGDGREGGGGYARHNDTSVVLSSRVDTEGGKRVLLTGDIQADAMADMTSAGLDTRADILELPHHGSFPPGAAAWVAATGAEVVLQSTGGSRLSEDRWAAPLAGIRRHVSEWHGQVDVQIGWRGEIVVERFVKKTLDSESSQHVQ